MVKKYTKNFKLSRYLQKSYKFEKLININCISIVVSCSVKVQNIVISDTD